ncbi:MAG: hypothetical protein HQ582_31580 [Planctomycetes bacterium]|nr:hypothetical protein [Planctomycetota bacterium]
MSIELANSVQAKSPLVITGTRAHSGCKIIGGVVGEIEPGGSQAMGVEVVADAPGILQTQVDIATNDPIRPLTAIWIVGYVLKPDANTPGGKRNGVVIEPIGQGIPVPGKDGSLFPAIRIENNTSKVVNVRILSGKSKPADAKAHVIPLGPRSSMEETIEVDIGDFDSLVGTTIEVEFPLITKP